MNNWSCVSKWLKFLLFTRHGRGGKRYYQLIWTTTSNSDILFSPTAFGGRKRT
ncbi:MAG: hypothetical protein LBR79_04205 [Oscillospiraceae bacterium]|nr:hypothetical protein [Oscillospiraceae bacterium]